LGTGGHGGGGVSLGTKDSERWVLGFVGEERSQSDKKALDGWVGLQETEGSLVIEHLFSNFQTLKCFQVKNYRLFQNFEKNYPTLNIDCNKAI
jgi:hypothetical protein